MYRLSKLNKFGSVCLTVALFLALPMLSWASGPALGDMVFNSKLESMHKAGVTAPVFPHTRHEELLKCEECHNSIFVDKRGANDISMRKNMKGEFCGSPNCHNSPKAFPLYLCAKCHKK